jgi:tetratricopeptide (TPR) repeat protein
MGVRYVLEGSVRKTNEQVRIIAQLIDATTGEHLWSERYDRPLTDIFTVQDEIVQKIATTLKLQLAAHEQGFLARNRTENLEAYDAWLRGVEYFARFTKEANVQAQQMFEQAIALDLQYADAYARLGMTYWIRWVWRWSTDPQTLDRAFELAHQAVTLDDSLSSAHSLLSIVYGWRHQYEQAIAEGERAVALDPNNAQSYFLLGEVLNSAGRPEEALKMMEQVRRLNPRHPPSYLIDVGLSYNLTGRYAEAVVTLKELMRQIPNHLTALLLLTDSYLAQWASQQGADAQTLEQALAATHRAIALNDAHYYGHRALGTVYLWQKQYEQALAEMKQAIALDSDRAGNYAVLAETLSRVGRVDEAVGMVEQALHRKPLVIDEHLSGVGAAYYLAGKPEEAVAPLKQFLARYPNILGAHLTLAAVYSELGKEAEARAEIAEVLRLNPNFSLEVHKEREPIKDPTLLERHIAALRKAGLK